MQSSYTHGEQSAGWVLGLGAGTVGKLLLAGGVDSKIVGSVDPATHPAGKAGSAVRVEELKFHIHSELFGDRFPTMPAVEEWKEQRKQAIMLQAVKIMRRHDQTDKDIVRMLEDKFFLSQEQAHAFLKDHTACKEQAKEEQSCQSL